jgi:outer membrane immunogenic protein
MKKSVTGIAAIAAMIGAPAFAADMPIKAAPVVAVLNWTGCHVGGSFGVSWASDGGYSTTSASSDLFMGTSASVPSGVGLTNSFGASGPLGGVDVGCDYQAGNWVLGAEADWSVTHTFGSASIVTAPNFLVIPVPSGGSVFYNGSDVWMAQERWLATARIRLGYASDKWLLYVTGGAAWASIQSTELATAFVNTNVSQTDTRTGWTIGTGVDYALAAEWSARAEYLYVRFPNYMTFTPGSGPGYANFGWITNLNNSFTNNVLRVGLNYDFK